MRYNEEDRTNVYGVLQSKFGLKQQVIVTIEELSELQKALCKALRGEIDFNNLIEEIADVSIVLEQVMYYFDITKDEVENAMDDKIERTKKRYLDV